MKKNDETKAIKVKRYRNKLKSADKAPYLLHEDQPNPAIQTPDPCGIPYPPPVGGLS